MKGLSKINLWSSDPSTVNDFFKNVPWKTLIESKDAVYPTTLDGVVDGGPKVIVVVISSGIENVNVVLLSDAIQTRPALRVTVEGAELTSTSCVFKILKDIVACAAVRDRGTYPIFLAKETTFSLTVAESRKDSLTTMFELNAVMYVLYAKVSIKTEKLDPSKSKSVKSEFVRR